MENSNNCTPDNEQALKDDKSLALKIGFFNAAGFVAAALITTYVDARINHVIYGQRLYQYGYLSALFAIPIVASTYLLIFKCSDQTAKSIGACLPLILSGWFSVQYIFKPEYPHANITTWVLAYCGISVITIWIRYAGKKIDYLHKPEVALEARLEAIKTHINIWQTFTIAISVAYIAILGVWFDKAWTNVESIVSSKQDKFLISSTLVYEIIIFSFYVIIGPIRESFSKTLIMSERFAEIVPAITVANKEIEI